eukprot:Skav217928  [mRNA]  locus=scaffold2633:142423:147978:- [translate_table: standard]
MLLLATRRPEEQLAPLVLYSRDVPVAVKRAGENMDLWSIEMLIGTAPTWLKPECLEPELLPGSPEAKSCRNAEEDGEMNSFAAADVALVVIPPGWCMLVAEPSAVCSYETTMNLANTMMGLPAGAPRVAVPLDRG